MGAETTLEFFAIIGVFALIGVTLYIVLCVILAIGGLIWEHRINKELEKYEDKPEVHDGSMD